jgi:hypothetical protein
MGVKVARLDSREMLRVRDDMYREYFRYCNECERRGNEPVTYLEFVEQFRQAVDDTQEWRDSVWGDTLARSEAMRQK